MSNAAKCFAMIEKELLREPPHKVRALIKCAIVPMLKKINESKKAVAEEQLMEEVNLD